VPGSAGLHSGEILKPPFVRSLPGCELRNRSYQEKRKTTHFTSKKGGIAHQALFWEGRSPYSRREETVCRQATRDRVQGGCKLKSIACDPFAWEKRKTVRKKAEASP